MRSTAVKGLTPGKWVSPFYDTGRRFLGFSPATVDSYIAAHGTASQAGRVVTLTAPGLPAHTGSVRVGHTAKASRWVNHFNERAGAH
jgi:hypothetical protein